MSQLWDIEYYKSPAEQEPILDFINNLEVPAQVKVARALDLLAEFGIALRSSHTKKLSGVPFWELRIVGSDNIRIFYIAKAGRSFLILHGFKKKQQKTDIKEIKVAMRRWQEYTVRK